MSCFTLKSHLPLLVTWTLLFFLGEGRWSLGARTPKLRSFIDLSYSLSKATQQHPVYHPFSMEISKLKGFEDIGINVQLEVVVSAAHFGTHIDAPRHFLPEGWAIEDIPPENLYGPGVLIDVSAQCSKDPNYMVTKNDILAFEKRHGRIPERGIVLFRTGWGKFWNDTKKFLGTDTNDPRQLVFPGIGRSAAELLCKERNIVGVGLDSMALDAASNFNFDAHLLFGQNNKWGLEAAANLHLLPPTGFQIYVFPMVLVGSSGATSRVIAFLN